jgi:hypothetical protein
MRILDKATPAPKPKSRNVQVIAYIYAAILVVMALCQLFNFDDFVALLNSFWMPGGRAVANLAGGVMVVCEVFALPFLLGMRLSKLMRIISMVLGWLVPIGWLKLTLWLCLTVNAVSNVGFLGTVVELAPGWWAVFVSIALGTLAAWASWGMWPIKNVKQRSAD